MKIVFQTVYLRLIYKIMGNMIGIINFNKIVLRKRGRNSGGRKLRQLHKIDIKGKISFRISIKEKMLLKNSIKEMIKNSTILKKHLGLNLISHSRITKAAAKNN